MFDSLPDVPLSTEQNGVATGRSSEGELVQSQTFSSGSYDPFPGRSGEFEGSNREFGDLGESLIIQYCSNEDDGLGVVGVRVDSLFDDSGEGNRGSVDLANK